MAEETAAPRVRARALDLPLGRFRPGQLQRHHRRGRRAGRPHHHHPRARARCGRGRARCAPASPPSCPTTGNIFMERLHRRRLRAQRRRRGLRHDAGDGVGPDRDAHPAHQHHVGGRGVRRAWPATWSSSYPGIGDEHDVIIPVVGECDDSWLNDITGRHVQRRARAARRSAPRSRRPGGRGQRGRRHRHGDLRLQGAASAPRRASSPRSLGGYTLGVLVMSNFGKMHNLRVGGLPVGEVLAEKFRDVPRRGADATGRIIAVVATDAPLLPHQINRLCKRVALGIGRVGSYAAHGSGEIVVGFSTANVIPRRTRKMVYQDEDPPRSAARPALRGGDGGHRGGHPQLDVHGRAR